MNLANLSPLAVLLPILGAALAFVLIRHTAAQRAVSIGILSLTLILESFLLFSVWNGGTTSVTLGGWLLRGAWSWWWISSPRSCWWSPRW